MNSNVHGRPPAVLRCRVASSARAVRQLALLPCLSSEPAPCPLSGTLSHSLPSPSRSPARVHEHGHAMAAASTTSCALLLPLPPAKLGSGTVHGLQWPSLSPPEPPVPAEPTSVAALFPLSTELVAWSRCCSWSGHFRLPPSKLCPSLGAHGPHHALAPPSAVGNGLCRQKSAVPSSSLALIQDQGVPA